VKKIPFTYIRGGTSRAVFFQKKNLPENRDLWHEIFRRALGLSQDAHGASNTFGKQLPTNKIAVIAPSERPGFDVDYHFFQMNEHTGIGDDRGTCGNMSSAVGPFATDHGLVPAKEGENTLRVYNINTGKTFLSTFFVKDGLAERSGEVYLPGLPEGGSPVILEFLNPGGGYSGKLFPTGNKKDRIDCGTRGETEITLIDCVNPIVIVRAADVGMTGKELKNEEIRPSSRNLLQMIRGKAAVLLGLVEKWEEAARTSTYIPHMAIVAEAAAYETATGEMIRKHEMDFCARAVFTKLHPTFPAGGAMATAVAAHIPGTILDGVWNRRKRFPESPKTIIGHPGGCIEIPVEIEEEEVRKATLLRTARHLFEGELSMD
jgi:2-methylaconitate cis-trans-isomerase PrpF